MDLGATPQEKDKGRKSSMTASLRTEIQWGFSNPSTSITTTPSLLMLE